MNTCLVSSAVCYASQRWLFFKLESLTGKRPQDASTTGVWAGFDAAATNVGRTTLFVALVVDSFDVVQFGESRRSLQ